MGETSARPATGTPALAQVTPYFGEVYANPQVSQTALDDIFFDVEGWLKSEVADDFTEDEGDGFVNGTGVNKPKGFLAYASAATADASRAFGTLEHMVAASATAIDPDELIDLIYKFKRKHRKKLAWQLNGLSLAAVRKLKQDGKYIWAPGLQNGQPDKLLGYPVEENDDMPDMVAGDTPHCLGQLEARLLHC